MRIAVVIPTYKPHLPFVPRLLESINKQTRLPDLVVVHASSCGPEEEATLEAIRAISLQFQLILASTERVQMPAENRNDGVALVPSDYEILSFFDSDDLMHPRRLELLEQCFQDPSIDVVVHSSQKGPLEVEKVEWTPVEEPLRIHRDAASLKFEPVYNPYYNKNMEIFRVVFEEEVPPQVNGPCSVRRHCFEKVQCDPNAHGYEDTLFLAELYREGFNIVALDAELFYYSGISEEETRQKGLSIIKNLYLAGRYN